MKTELKEIAELWQEHLNTPFPNILRGNDLDGIDFVMLDADIAGCAQAFLKSGRLNLFQTAVLGLSYRNASFVVPQLNGDGSIYFARLERLAKLVLKEVAIQNDSQD